MSTRTPIVTTNIHMTTDNVTANIHMNSTNHVESDYGLVDMGLLTTLYELRVLCPRRSGLNCLSHLMRMGLIVHVGNY